MRSCGWRCHVTEQYFEASWHGTHLSAERHRLPTPCLGRRHHVTCPHHRHHHQCRRCQQQQQRRLAEWAKARHVHRGLNSADRLLGSDSGRPTWRSVRLQVGPTTLSGRSCLPLCLGAVRRSRSTAPLAGAAATRVTSSFTASVPALPANVTHRQEQ